MPKRPRETPSYERLNVIVTKETALRIDEARAALRRAGVRVSMSALMEIALLEMLARKDLADVLRKRGAKARRDDRD